MNSSGTVRPRTVQGSIDFGVKGKQSSPNASRIKPKAAQSKQTAFEASAKQLRFDKSADREHFVPLDEPGSRDTPDYPKRPVARTQAPPANSQAPQGIALSNPTVTVTSLRRVKGQDQSEGAATFPAKANRPSSKEKAEGSNPGPKRAALRFKQRLAQIEHTCGNLGIDLKKSAATPDQMKALDKWMAGKKLDADKVVKQILALPSQESTDEQLNLVTVLGELKKLRETPNHAEKTQAHASPQVPQVKATLKDFWGACQTSGIESVQSDWFLKNGVDPGDLINEVVGDAGWEGDNWEAMHSLVTFIWHASRIEATDDLPVPDLANAVEFGNACVMVGIEDTGDDLHPVHVEYLQSWCKDKKTSPRELMHAVIGNPIWNGEQRGHMHSLVNLLWRIQEKPVAH
jgi:hypothetical protein